MPIDDNARNATIASDAADTTTTKEPYTAPALVVVGTVEQLTEGAVGGTPDFKKTGSL